MKNAFALVFALSAALSSLALPAASPEPDASPAPVPEVMSRQEYCPIPAPNLGVIDRIYRYARGRGVNSKVMLSMFECASVESHFNNLPCGDQDSIGVFQQRPSMGWGSYNQIMNIEYSAGKYLDRAIAVDRQRPGLSAGQLAQAVQISEFPYRYDQHEGEARKWLNVAIQRNGGSGSGGAINVGGTPGKNTGGGGSNNSGSNTSGCAKTVTVKSGNTCSGIASANGISVSTLRGLNSGINSGCTNLQINQKLCVKKGTSSTSNSKGGCSRHYTVQQGNTCSLLASKGGVSVSRILQLNPGINGGCTNLQIGKSYCIA